MIGKNKQVLLTIDLEDWYDLHYLEKYSLSKEPFFLKRLYPFLSFLDDFNIKATFFVVAEIVLSHRSLIEDIASRGHEIACHGLDHRRLDTKSLELIKIELQEARNLLGPIANEEVIGYRAPAFSISDEVFPLLRNLGFTYDSSLSYSRASNKIDSGLNELPINSIRFLGKDIFWSGGAYLRVLPLALIKVLARVTNRPLVLWLHPFELNSDLPPQVDLLSIKDKFRMNLKRSGSPEKITQLILFLFKNNYNYIKVKDYFNGVNSRGNR